MIKHWPKILISIISIFISFIVASEAQTKKKKKIRVGYFEVQPHMIKNIRNPTRPTGFLVEYITKYIAPKLDREIEWIGPYNSALRLWAEVKKQNIDVIPLIQKHKEDEQNFYYSKKPLGVGTHSLLVPNKFKFNKIKDSSQLKGVYVCHFLGPKYFYRPIFLNGKVNIVNMTGVDWMDRCFHMLKYGRIDAVYSPFVLSIKYILKKFKMREGYKIITLPYDKEPGYFLISKVYPEAKAVLNQINKIMDEAPMTYMQFLIKKLTKLKVLENTKKK